MRIEDREDYIDMVAQAVIDKIEERDRVASLVELVAQRVMELQKAQTQLEQASDPVEEIHDVRELAEERNNIHA